MSRELLSTWLDLPATPWPPDHYALLGLPAGQGTTEEIERRVLERMESLRRYQLLHPDAVTEGMNLLAQALIYLTDPEARQEYDRLRQGERVAPAAAGEPPIPEVPLIEIPAYVPPPARRTRFAEPAPIVPEPLPMPQPPDSATVTVYSLDEEAPAIGEAPAEEIIIPELIEEPLPPDVEEADEGLDELVLPPERAEHRPLAPTLRDLERESHRSLYAELVRIRRVLRVWERLRQFLDEPEKAFARRTETVAFMNCLSDLRPLLPTVADLVGASGQPGNLVAVLSRQQLVVEMFRSLLPSQRDALARDCRSAHYTLSERYHQLRQQACTLNAKGFARRVWNPMLRQVVARPEWLLLIVGIVALVVAFVRSVPQ